MGTEISWFCPREKEWMKIMGNLKYGNIFKVGYIVIDLWKTHNCQYMTK